MPHLRVPACAEPARQLHPGIEFRPGDAERLPLGNGLFDSAVINFGILHFGQPELALEEAARVIRAGGYFAFTAWARPEDTIGFNIVLRSVEAYGEPRIKLPEGPPFFRFSDPAECVRGLTGAGFENPTVVKVPQLWRLSSGEASGSKSSGCRRRCDAISTAAQATIAAPRKVTPAPGVIVVTTTPAVAVAALAAILGIAFLVKAGMWPVGMWLPTTYAAAAPPVAAMFSIMSKLGLYVLLLTARLFRFLFRWHAPLTGEVRRHRHAIVCGIEVVTDELEWCS